MTRRLAERHPRRLLRARPVAQRPEHGLDLAVPDAPGDVTDDAGPSQRALRALAEENALLARELGRVQARCTQWRDDCIVQAERLEALLMRARGELIAKETQLAAVRDTLAALHERAAVWLTNEELVRRMADLRARNRSLEHELADARHHLDEVASAASVPAARPAALPELPASDARRVLCVGGRARQIPVYRALVERRGGVFAHIDGASADCLPALRRSLAQADLVILQPGYACQGACHAVETHCASAGVRCVQLAKACVVGFERSLEQAVAGA